MEHAGEYSATVGCGVPRKYLVLLVGVTGFEPATYTSRT